MGNDSNGQRVFGCFRNVIKEANKATSEEVLTGITDIINISEIVVNQIGCIIIGHLVRNDDIIMT